MKIKNETTMSNILRHLLDFELEANGWSTGEIREVRRYIAKKPVNVHQRRLLQRYQSLRRTVVAAEDEAAAKAAKRAERVAYALYQLGELEAIPDAEVRERCLKLAALWPVVEPNVPFPGVGCWEDRMAKDGRFNWYLNGENLKGDLPAMICSNGRLTQDRTKRNAPAGRLGYRYSTVTVRTALARAVRGKELFNYGA